MQICIPTEDDRALDARVYDHFGSAPFFALADTESGDIEMLDNTKGRHRHGECEPIDHIDADQTDAVVCRGIGKRACASLERAGVDVLITAAHTVRDVIAEAREKKLRRLSTDEACGGHSGKHRRHSH